MIHLRPVGRDDAQRMFTQYQRIQHAQDQLGFFWILAADRGTPGLFVVSGAGGVYKKYRRSTVTNGVLGHRSVRLQPVLVKLAVGKGHDRRVHAVLGAQHLARVAALLQPLEERPAETAPLRLERDDRRRQPLVFRFSSRDQQ